MEWRRFDIFGLQASMPRSVKDPPTVNLLVGLSLMFKNENFLWLYGILTILEDLQDFSVIFAASS